MYYTPNPFWVIFGFLGHFGVRWSRFLGQMILNTLPVCKLTYETLLYPHPLSSYARIDRQTLENIEEIVYSFMYGHLHVLPFLSPEILHWPKSLRPISS